MDQQGGMGWFFFFFMVASIVFSFIGLLYLRLLHKVRGGTYRKEARTPALLMFTTKFGDYRVSKQHKQVSFKAKGFTDWEVVYFDHIVCLYRQRESDYASLIELFFGGFNMFDFFGQYRDRINSSHILLNVRNGDDIPLVSLKQYEQREWFLGQLIHDFQIYILKKLGWYTELEDESEQWMKFFYDKLSAYDKDLRLKQ